MTLTHCSACGAALSDKLAACPQCHAPIVPPPARRRGLTDVFGAFRREKRLMSTDAEARKAELGCFTMISLTILLVIAVAAAFLFL